MKILEVHLNSTSPWLKFRIKFQLLFEKNFDNSFVFMKHRFSSDTEKWLRFKLQVTRKPDQGKIVADENWLESSKQRWLFIVVLFAVINVTKAIFSSPSSILFTRTCRKRKSVKNGKEAFRSKNKLSLLVLSEYKELWCFLMLWKQIGYLNGLLSFS